jgi:hypothetical protein
VSYDQFRPLQNLHGQSPLEAAHGGGQGTSAPGCTLSYDDVTHYGKIVVALKETMRLMAEIDEIIPSWPIE